MNLRVVIYLISAALLLILAYFVFNHIVARDYLQKGRLGRVSAILQLLIFVAFFCFPYLYLPAQWAWDWMPNGTWNKLAALVLVCLGMLVAFGTMIWFGIAHAFGLKMDGIVKSGPYRYSRNPQMLGGWVIVVGIFVYQPSLYSLVWLLIWAIIGHWMVTNEEIHLRRQFGEDFDRYCTETPRYFFRW
ncbi:MAG: methyltransferase family protein [Anaerolineales bacterium]